MAEHSAFISFAREDAAIAEQLARELQRRGVTTFRADQEIAPGESWAARLQDQISRSSLVFTIVSRASVASEFVASETALALAQAQEGHTIVVPVIVEPGVELPYFLRHIQALHFSDPPSRSDQDALDSVLRYADDKSLHDSDQSARTAEARIGTLRSYRHSLDVEKAMFDERRKVWSSALTASMGILVAVVGLLAGVTTIADLKPLADLYLPFILGVILGIVGSGIAFLILMRLRAGRNSGDRE